MPEIYKYHCNHCHLYFPQGWGGYTYVKNDQGDKICCPHPGEAYTIREVLGKNASPELISSRIGFNSLCICLDCLEHCNIDIEKEKRICHDCGSHRVKTLLELVDGTCPKCKVGTIVAEDTGIIC